MTTKQRDLPDELISLPDASQQIGVPYYRLYHAVIGNVVPAERNPTGKSWRLRVKNLPAIAAILGVETPAEHAA